MSWLHGISARSLRHIERLEIDLHPPPGHERRHLVLIGPNGSGKSLLLANMAEELEAVVEGRPHPAAEVALRRGDPEQLDREVRLAHLGRPVRLSWARTDRELRDAFASGRFVLAYLPDPRDTSVSPASSASPLDTDPKRPHDRIGARLLQLLGNRKSEQQLAKESGDALRAKVHEAWFLRVQSSLRRLLHQPELALVHDRNGFHLDLPDGRRMHFDELSHGHASAVAIWAELMMRVEAARLRNDDPMLEPAGVVLIDTVEIDLDVRLQRELLPALAQQYPGVQLVVSTHSPLVAMSLDEALILDVVTRRGRSGEEVHRAGLEALLVSMLGLELAERVGLSSRPPPGLPSAPPPRSASSAGRLPAAPAPSPGSLQAPISRSAPPPARSAPPPARSAPQPPARSTQRVSPATPATTVPATTIPAKNKPAAAGKAPPPVPPVSAPLPPLEPDDTQPNVHLPAARLGRSLTPLPPVSPARVAKSQPPRPGTIPPPPGKLPPGKDPVRRSRKRTLSGSGNWGPEET